MRWRRMHHRSRLARDRGCNIGMLGGWVVMNCARMDRQSILKNTSRMHSSLEGGRGDSLLNMVLSSSPTGAARRVFKSFQNCFVYGLGIQGSKCHRRSSYGDTSLRGASSNLHVPITIPPKCDSWSAFMSAVCHIRSLLTSSSIAVGAYLHLRNNSCIMICLACPFSQYAAPRHT